MDSAQLITLLLILIGFGVLYFALRKNNTSSNDNETFLKLFQGMQQEIQSVNETVNKTLNETQQNINTRLFQSTSDVNKRLDNAAKVIGDVQKNLGEMSEIGRGMRDLQEFLQSPKLRGNIGEQVLKQLLGQMLPKSSFHLQYAFKSGSIVDAAIVTEAGIIPIDSKFPMDNFRRMMAEENGKEKASATREFEREVKKHIDDVSKKYILTHEGTIDYALMYVPSESVYYEIVNSPTLFEHASKKAVLPVSPVTFYAYLRSIMMSFEGQKISAKAREVLSSIRAVAKEHEKLGDDLGTLSKHIQNSYNMMNNVNSGYMKLGQQISSTKNISVEEKKMVERS
jgi:DNA recombination protein RmuC